MKNFALILQIINSNGSVQSLIRRGFTYNQVAKLIDSCLHEGYLIYKNDNLELTVLGQDRLNMFIAKGFVRNDGGWISTEAESKIDQIDELDLYLPKKFKHLRRKG